MSKYTEYYIPVTVLLTEALQNIKELVENDPWNDIGQASPITLKDIYGLILDVEEDIESLDNKYINSFPMP
jgi:hypothetical protein